MKKRTSHAVVPRRMSPPPSKALPQGSHNSNLKTPFEADGVRFNGMELSMGCRTQASLNLESQSMTSEDSSSHQLQRKKRKKTDRAYDGAEHNPCPNPSTETLVSFEQKVLAALEREQARIARELHDDINQRITILIWESRKMDQCPPGQEERRRKS